MFNDIKDAINWIETQFKFRPKASLDKMHAAYEKLNIDLSHMKKVHVAGTNGKGSVSEFVTNYALLKGVKVGTFTSPYIVKFNERIRINGKNISDDDLLNYINFIYEFNETFRESYGEPLSFFELLTLIAFKYFYDQEVELIVMEVGIGGLLDATNVIDYDLSLITNIGWDHMKQLGNTLESIASNKLGILKKDGYLITTVDEELHDYFYDYANKIGAKIKILKDFPVAKRTHPVRFDFEGHEHILGLHGDYQIKNAILGIEAGRYLLGELNLIELHELLLRTKLPGRFSMIKPLTYLDGAHNISGMRALVDYAKTLDKEFLILFSALADKDICGMLDILEELSNRIILTEFPDPRFTSLRGYLREGMAYNEDPMHALKQLEYEREAGSHRMVLITGSLHFTSYMYNRIRKERLEAYDYEEQMDLIAAKYDHDDEGDY